jgi:uncharacterized protein (DUF302 family)
MYEFHLTLDQDFDQAVERLHQALASEHLAVITDVDVQTLLKDKLDKEIAPYRIFGACHPGLADRIIGAEPNAGTLLPCSLVVRAEGDKTVVSFMDPMTVLGLSSSDELHAVASEVRVMLQKVLDRLDG